MDEMIGVGVIILIISGIANPLIYWEYRWSRGEIIDSCSDTLSVGISECRKVEDYLAGDNLVITQELFDLIQGELAE